MESKALTFNNGEALLSYISNKRLGLINYSRKVAINDCTYFLSLIDKSEELFFVCIADYQNESTVCMNGVIGVTNRRLLVAKKGFTQNISLDNINGISMLKSGASWMGLAKITIDTTGEAIKLTTNINYGDSIYHGLDSVINERKLALVDTSKTTNTNSGVQFVADELKSLMELMYIGIITEDEFNKKKKELLGL